MVTQTVICVTPTEAAKLAAAESWSSREADSIIKRASTPTNDGSNERSGNNEELEKQVELQVGFRTIRVQQRGVIRPAPAACTPTQSTICRTSNNAYREKKRALPTEADESISYEETVMKHQRINAFGMVERGGPTHSLPVIHPPQNSWFFHRFEIDLSDVPPQLPILKNERRIKELSSKYAGVTYSGGNKWRAQITIDGKQLTIGYYYNEEEAAIDYARALFKYKGQEALDKVRERNGSIPVIDLSDVPPQQPILKHKGWIKEGAKKYVGVSFNKRLNKWQARIMIDGKERSIGYYENEEEAAIDYARALFKYKYKRQGALDKASEQNSSGSGEQKSSGSEIVTNYSTSSNSAHRYQGEKKRAPKSEASIIYKETRAMKHQKIGAFGRWEGKRAEASICYEEAAIKHQRIDDFGRTEEMERHTHPVPIVHVAQSSYTDRMFRIDLSDVPPQEPIPKTRGRVKEGASRYTGVHLNRARNKWKAEIVIEGKLHHIGFYEDEGEAAADYARALFKYHGQEALDKARARGRISSRPETVIDLNDVAQQQPQPMPRSEERIKGASKYEGATFDKRANKWVVRPLIDENQRLLGYYDYLNEDSVAVDCTRAVFKHRGHETLNKVAEQTLSFVDVNDVPPQPKHQRLLDPDEFVLDLSNVPPQPVIPKRGTIKEGSSKYKGVSFRKGMNKWKASIVIDGKLRHIGNYESEEEAATDYARAVFKYQGLALNSSPAFNFDLSDVPPQQPKPQQPQVRDPDEFVLDLSDVPPQPLFYRSGGHKREGSSIYTGVYFNKRNNKWTAQITIDETLRYIGCYENEEEAAIDYARAAFKYRYQRAPRTTNSSGSGPEFDLSEAEVDSTTNKNGEEKKCALPSGGAMISDREVKKCQRTERYVLDLSDVPPQLPIPKSKGHIKEGSSKYAGVTFHKAMNKWGAKINIDGKQRHIGYYENEEEAAIDYARAAFKYKGEDALDKEREQKDSEPGPAINIDLSDVLPQPLIRKSKWFGGSKYTGVNFDKSANKWKAEINIDGKERHIGYYENEGEAAADYARAAFKYQGQETLDEAREPIKSTPAIDLSDVPPQPLIYKSKWFGGSKYAGVSFNKASNKWMAQITMEGKVQHIGYYENEEEAAADYARAVFKYNQCQLDQKS